MSSVLFCTVRMQRGYGVDRVVHEVSEQLALRGHTVRVLCTTADDTHAERGYEVTEIPSPTLEDTLQVAEEMAADAVVAHSSPFVEFLPMVRHRFPSWIWDHGDPTPELFGAEGEQRAALARYKNEFCLPVVDGVIAISEFVRADIGWPAAEVIYDGCDHAPDLGSKGLQDVRPALERPLEVGTLLRMGSGEARYKGNRIFLGLAEAVAASGLPVEVHVMGRGTERDAREFRAAGCRVHLNATDEEKWEYLRDLDVFVSPSLWEGFNLPLVEAQAVGTLALAFDTGAHPETCPLTFAGLDEMVAFIGRAAADSGLLRRHALTGYRFVRNRFRWAETARRFEELVLAAAAEPRQRRGAVAAPRPRRRRGGRLARWRRNVAATLTSLRQFGLRITVQRVRRKLRATLLERNA